MRHVWRASILLAMPMVVGAAAPVADMNPLADRYVKLVLAVGQHDDALVDAYYGPAEWKTAAKAAGKRPLTELLGEAEGLAGELAATAQPDDNMARLRRDVVQCRQ